MVKKTGWNSEEEEPLLHDRAVGIRGPLPKNGQGAGHEFMGQD